MSDAITGNRRLDALPTLRSRIGQCFIVAYREDTTALEAALREEGLRVEVLRPTYTEEELRYSRTIRCLLNHASAWQRARENPALTLIVEADFVPCVGFGDMPLPFDPDAHDGKAWAFLYSGAPRLMWIAADGTLVGHSATPVAIVVPPRVAGWLTEYVDEELKRHGDLTKYSLWDTNFQWHIMGRGATCFISERQYGEHGGMPNFEHSAAGTGVASRVRLLRWLGLAGNHHADVLRAPLKFLPMYARGSRARYWLTRLEAKIFGVLRLLTGRTVALNYQPTFVDRLRVFARMAARLCGPY